MFECRWADCRLEFRDKELYKAHIRAHVEDHNPTPIRDIPNYRRAAGFTTGASAPQPGFEYLNNDGSQPLGTRRHFTELGLESQISPPMSPAIASPSLSSQIRSIGLPGRSQALAQDPMYALAAPYSENVTPDMEYNAPRSTTPPPTEEEAKFMDDMIKSPTPPPAAELKASVPSTPLRTATKRKQSGVKFNESTPATKKRKVIPKTPYPDSGDSDSDQDGEGSEDEAFIRAAIQARVSTGEVEELSGSPFIPQSQAFNRDEDELMGSQGPLVEEVLSSNGDHDELFTEEETVKSQLGDFLRVDDITTPSPEHHA